MYCEIKLLLNKQTLHLFFCEQISIPERVLIIAKYARGILVQTLGLWVSFLENACFKYLYNEQSNIWFFARRNVTVSHVFKWSMTEERSEN